MSPLVNPAEVEFVAIRAQGAGGQHVNKVSTAVHLRFDIRASSLPEDLKLKLLAWPDQRISSDGVLVIKSQGSRSQSMNRDDALLRLQALIDEVAKPVKRRRATRPTYGSQQRRLQAKGQRAQIKSGRSRVTD